MVINVLLVTLERLDIGTQAAGLLSAVRAAVAAGAECTATPAA